MYCRGILNVNTLRSTGNFLRQSVSVPFRMLSFDHNYKNRFFMEPNLQDVKKQLRLLEGGQISLSKDEHSGIAQICIDHIDKKNSLSGKMMVELNEVIEELEQWDQGKGIIFYSIGNEDTFCSGGYLETMKKLSPEDAFRMSALMQDSSLRLRNLSLVSVAVIHGKALGGGAELTLWTDYRLFTSTAELAFVQARMGITTGWGGGILLKDIVGRQRALDILLTSRKLKAEEGQSLGLVDGTVDRDLRVDQASAWLLAKIKNHSVDVVHAVKRNSQCHNLGEERQVFGSIWGTPSHLDKLARNIKHK